jgi:hypothetical protein
MADKSTAIPIDICEDVPIVLANVTILTDFVILEMPEDLGISSIAKTYTLCGNQVERSPRETLAKKIRLFY